MPQPAARKQGCTAPLEGDMRSAERAQSCEGEAAETQRGGGAGATGGSVAQEPGQNCATARDLLSVNIMCIVYICRKENSLLLLQIFSHPKLALALQQRLQQTSEKTCAWVRVR